MVDESTIGAHERMLTNFAFLAALNENNTDLYDAVYLPLCKMALTKLAQHTTAGKAEDLQTQLHQLFGLDVPLVVIRALLLKIQKRLSNREQCRTGFEVFEKGASFQMKAFVFDGYQTQYDRQERNTNKLKEKFREYVEANGHSIEAVAPIERFIEIHKSELSAFFAGRDIKVDVSESFLLHAKFLKKIEATEDELYKTIQQIFIGSIIASYIESNFDVLTKPNFGITYFLDTQVVLSALDLQSADATKPIKELLRLITDTGGKLRVLDITLRELERVIGNAISKFDMHSPTTTINEACVRCGKTKTWLVMLKSELLRTLKKEFDVDVVNIALSTYQSLENHEDVKKLQAKWVRKNTATHDAMAYLYVRLLRKVPVVSIQKADYWFVTLNDVLYDFNARHSVLNSIGETIMVNELTSLLFLSNPSKFGDRVSKIGIGELVARTLMEEYPSKDLLNEFDNAVKDVASLSEEQYAILMSEISTMSSKNLTDILSVKAESPNEFKSEINDIIRKEKKRRDSDAKKRMEMESYLQNAKDNNERITNENQKLRSQLAELSASIDANMAMELRRWKRPRFICLTFLLIISIVAIPCIFIDFNHNFIYPLIDIVDTYKGVRKELFVTIMTTIMSISVVISVKGIYSLSKVKSKEDAANWFVGLFTKWFS